MKIVHLQNHIPEKVVKPTAKQVYHEQMVAALRRRQYKDFQAALKNPEVIEAIEKVRKVSPGFTPKFEG